MARSTAVPPPAASPSAATPTKPIAVPPPPLSREKELEATVVALQARVDELKAFLKDSSRDGFNHTKAHELLHK